MFCLISAIWMDFVVAGKEGEIINSEFFGCCWWKGLIFIIATARLPAAITRIEEIKDKIQNCCYGSSDSQHSESGSGAVRLVWIATTEPFDEETAD